VQAFEATKMPLPQGRCYGKYTDDARAAGVEGTVVLDIVVGEDGHVRDVQVAQGLGHGLDQAAIAALHACQFSPGEKDGKPVAVKIRGFKIRFVMQEQ
jgi:protein TonB